MTKKLRDVIDGTKVPMSVPANRLTPREELHLFPPNGRPASHFLENDYLLLLLLYIFARSTDELKLMSVVYPERSMI